MSSESDTKSRGSIRIEAGLHQEVKILASQKGKTVKCLTEQALRALLSQQQQGATVHDPDRS